MRRDPGSAFRTSATCRSAAAADRWVGAKGMGLPPAGMGLPPAVAGATPLRAMAVAAITSRVASLRTRRIGTWEPTKASPPVGACDGAGLCWGQAWRDPWQEVTVGLAPLPRPGARPQQHRGSAPGGGPGNAQAIRPAISTLGLRWRPGQGAPCIGWRSSMPLADRPQRRPGPRPGTTRTHRPGTCPPSSCASRAEPSPSTPVRPNPAGSACGTATAGCTAAPGPGSWVAASPSLSRPRSLPRCLMDPESGSRAGTTCCSPVRWRHHPNSAGPTLRLLRPPVPQPVLATGPCLVRGHRDRPVLHPGRRVGSPRPGPGGRPAP